ncbi:hypothetical protein MMC07_003027 [Pseudocyphellaria aurata]|nr:hypothetical protein [Pseudocyphellaria aurata]
MPSRHGEITPWDHGPYVIVTAYIMMVTMILFVMTRLITKALATRALHPDDYFIITSATFAIVQTIVVHGAVKNGLGKHRTSLSDMEFDRYSKFNYVGQILVIVAISLAKISLSLLITTITPSQSILVACRILNAVVVAWGCASIIALALQCDVPHPYDFTPGRCLNQMALYDTIGAFNILTDTAIIVLAVGMMWKVHVNARSRLIVIITFSMRSLVCGATVAQLVTLRPYFKSTDQTWRNVNFSICSEIMMHLSIITACIPLLKRFLTDLQTGLVITTIPDHHELSSSNKSRAPYWKHTNESDSKASENGAIASRASNGRKTPKEQEDDSIRLTQDGIVQTTDIRVAFHDLEGRS